MRTIGRRCPPRAGAAASSTCSRPTERGAAGCTARSGRRRPTPCCSCAAADWIRSILALGSGVEQLWDGARYFDGALTAAVSIDVPEACITSMYVALACYFGLDDPRVDAALSLVAGQPARRRRLELSDCALRRPAQLLPHLDLGP